MSTPLPGQPGFVLPDPADRPHFERRAVRVLVLDEDERVLLFLDSDLGLDPVAHWWDTPGGGVDPGESDREAVVRELAEETGQVVEDADVVGPLFERLVVHGYSDKVVEQTEVWFAVRRPAFEVDASGYTEEERLCIAETRWWSLADLASAPDEVWPADLADLVALVDRPDAWRAGAVAGEPVEESSLPA
ncbi:NUDIX hydrolase [Phycicoccus sp. HDW14]|uniref:NUDIX hydrolase n=1 Tax=Phycicoccus sp. HDW14 TaxID=2714941 RepID=UPI00197B41EF|nr:NUDIX domain-containing protein [Phycicoccus sp. HDW14]